MDLSDAERRALEAIAHWTEVDDPRFVARMRGQRRLAQRAGWIALGAAGCALFLAGAFLNAPAAVVIGYGAVIVSLIGATPMPGRIGRRPVAAPGRVADLG